MPLVATGVAGVYGGTGFGFITPWVDLNNCNLLSISAVFASGSSATGTMGIYTSNDQGNMQTKAYPATASGPTYPAVDSNLLPGSSQTILQNKSFGVYTYNVTGMGQRWFQVVFTPSGVSAGTATVSVYASAKSSAP